MLVTRPPRMTVCMALAPSFLYLLAKARFFPDSRVGPLIRCPRTKHVAPHKDHLLSSARLAPSFSVMPRLLVGAVVALALIPSPPPSVSPTLRRPSWPTAESLEPVWRISLGLSPLPMLGLRISPSWHFRVLERWHQSPLCFQLGAYATPSHVPCSAPLLPLAPLSIAAFVNLSSLTWAFVTDLRVSRSSVEDPSRPSLCGFRIRSALPLHQLV